MEGGGELVLGLNQAPSLNAVLRALKREEASLFSCVASIADDAQFVARVAARYPGLPLLPNLRCGLWYVRPPAAGTCYFKSTDGHNNNWSFSTVRLNLNVAQAAASAGGCLIVDATKRGKRFPDAMSKTIPMWAAVMNRAVHRLRAQGQQQPQQPAAGAEPAGSSSSSSSSSAWDCDVHLPPWVSEVEAHNIRQRLDGWVDALLEVGADLSPLVAGLRKPLRCIWVSQDSALWMDEVADVAGLAFMPLVLIGASATNSRQTRCLTLPAEGPGGEPLSLSYRYCPGAADDEESWSCGLTPALMWRHLRVLLAAGPAGIEPLARQLLEQEQAQQAQQAPEAAPAGTAGQRQADSKNCKTAAEPMATAELAAAAPPKAPQAAAAAAPGLHGAAALRQAAPPASNGASASLLQQPTDGGLHCLLPAGCRPAQAAAVQRVGAGICLLGDTGLALSDAAAAAAPAVWQHVDAVLHLGLKPLAGMQQEPQQQDHSTAGQPAASSEGAAATPPGAAACRYCWLPVRSSKEERHALEGQLPAALRFARAQLLQRRRLLLCCDSGLDASVCAAVACLLAFYRLDLQPGGGTQAALALPPGAGSSPAAQPPAAAAPAAAAAAAGEGNNSSSASQPQPLFTPAVGAAGFSKLAVRQHLAAVSARYPAARPTRASLRQVFNFFLQQLLLAVPGGEPPGL